MFQDRKEAGKKLAKELAFFRDAKDVIVEGLARGGVVVAAEVASELNLPLDVIIVRKIGAPDNEELALGAVASEGEGIFNEDLITLLGVSREYLKKETERQREKIREYRESFFQSKPPEKIIGKTVILVDDGIATGASMKVAIRSMKASSVAKIVLAVPVAASDSLEELSKMVDEVVCLLHPTIFHAVGAFYKDFSQTTDKEVMALIHKN